MGYLPFVIFLRLLRRAWLIKSGHGIIGAPRKRSPDVNRRAQRRAVSNAAAKLSRRRNRGLASGELVVYVACFALSLSWLASW